MNKKRLGNVICVGNFSITPVEQLNITNNDFNNGVYFLAAYEPLGILIECDGIQWAIDITGRQVLIADLISDCV